MAIEIVNATIHQIEKKSQTKDPGSVTLTPRDSTLPNDEILQRLCENLLGLYTKVASGNGTLGTDPDVHKFPVFLRGYLDEELEFMEFTRQALGVIQTQMEKSFLSTGGYALFLHYKTDQHELMLVVMLKLKAGAGIDAATLTLKENLNIDLSHLHEAARVNVSRWNAGEQPYLTFVKGRATTKKSDVSEYFRDALACTNYTDAKRHTEELIKAADEFTSTLDIPAEERQKTKLEMRKRLYDCFVDNQVELGLLTVSAAVYPQDPMAFVDHVQTNSDNGGYNLSDAFSPHKSTYYALHRFKGRMGTISVAFDVDDIRKERVRYDEDIDAILIDKPTKALRDAIKNNGTSSESSA